MPTMGCESSSCHCRRDKNSLRYALKRGEPAVQWGNEISARLSGRFWRSEDGSRPALLLGTVQSTRTKWD